MPAVTPRLWLIMCERLQRECVLLPRVLRDADACRWRTGGWTSTLMQAAGGTVLTVTKKRGVSRKVSLISPQSSCLAENATNRQPAALQSASFTRSHAELSQKAVVTVAGRVAAGAAAASISISSAIAAAAGTAVAGSSSADDTTAVASTARRLVCSCSAADSALNQY